MYKRQGDEVAQPGKLAVEGRLHLVVDLGAFIDLAVFRPVPYGRHFHDAAVSYTHLTGIPAAPRGVPQIEVTFDIDANGIVHVSAKDMATGNSQQVAITASTNLTDEDIDRAVKDAEAHAQEDKKRKEEIEVRNNAESLVYNCQKTITDLGDKISSEEKAKAETEIDNVKKALEGTDVEAIKSATEKLTQIFYSISEKVYSQTKGAENAANGAAGADGANAEGNSEPHTDGNGNVYDADYKVDEDNK